MTRYGDEVVDNRLPPSGPDVQPFAPSPQEEQAFIDSQQQQQAPWYAQPDYWARVLAGQLQPHPTQVPQIVMQEEATPWWVWPGVFVGAVMLIRALK